MTEETQVQNNGIQLNKSDLEEILNDVFKESVKSSMLQDQYTKFLETMNTMIKNNNVNGMKKLFAGYFLNLKDENSNLFEDYAKRTDDLGYLAKAINTIHDTEKIKEILAEVVGEDVADEVIKDYENRGLLDEIKKNAVLQYLRRSDNEKIKNAFIQWKRYIAEIGGIQFNDKIAKYLH